MATNRNLFPPNRSPNKSAQASTKKGFYTNRNPNKHSFLYEAAQNFEVFSNIQK